MFKECFGKGRPLDKEILFRSLEKLKSRITPTCPQTVLVFGSVARGEAHEDSDIDLLLVYSSDRDIAEARESIYGNLKEPLCELPTDLIFVTKDEFLRKSKTGGVCYLANLEGKLLDAILGERDESKATVQERICS